MLDRNEIKFTQTSLIIILIISWIINLNFIPLILGIVMIIGATIPALAIFRLIYRYMILPLKLIHPKLIEDVSNPHRFAQLIAGFLLLIAGFLLIKDYIFIGWSIALIVIIFASINITSNFCIGCFFYYRLNQLGILRFFYKNRDF